MGRMKPPPLPRASRLPCVCGRAACAHCGDGQSCHTPELKVTPDPSEFPWEFIQRVHKNNEVQVAGLNSPAFSFPGACPAPRGHKRQGSFAFFLLVSRSTNIEALLPHKIWKAVGLPVAAPHPARSHAVPNPQQLLSASLQTCFCLSNIVFDLNWQCLRIHLPVQHNYSCLLHAPFSALFLRWTGLVMTRELKLLTSLSDSTKGVAWLLSVTALAAPPNIYKHFQIILPISFISVIICSTLLQAL